MNKNSLAIRVFDDNCIVYLLCVFIQNLVIFHLIEWWKEIKRTKFDMNLSKCHDVFRNISNKIACNM